MFSSLYFAPKSTKGILTCLKLANDTQRKCTQFVICITQCSRSPTKVFFSFIVILSNCSYIIIEANKEIIISWHQGCRHQYSLAGHQELIIVCHCHVQPSSSGCDFHCSAAWKQQLVNYRTETQPAYRVVQ